MIIELNQSHSDWQGALEMCSSISLLKALLWAVSSWVLNLSKVQDPTWKIIYPIIWGSIVSMALWNGGHQFLFLLLLYPPSHGRQPGLSVRIWPWFFPDDFSCPLLVLYVHGGVFGGICSIISSGNEMSLTGLWVFFVPPLPSWAWGHLSEFLEDAVASSGCPALLLITSSVSFSFVAF